MNTAGVALTGLLATYLTACAALAGAGSKPAAVRYDRDIRPILSDQCFKCHGPDDANRQGGLRLDRRQDLFTRQGAGTPVVPGKPEASRLWVRIIAADPAQRMPPVHSGKSLTPRQKELVRTWIMQGAPWTQHWAFVPPTRPALPKVKNAAWVRSPIDAFVLARLEKEGLKPSPEADRVTLLRRLSLDLVGLPPTPEEVDAFLADTKPGAYERQVERLLASPHYGEKWGRQWLDAARYADSDGFEKDKPRFVYFYRDWVVNALNRDLPYDRFIIEQIAGDLLPNPTQDQRVATGFLRNSMINEEGGVDPEQFRMEAMFDRMDAIGKGVLGLTIQCAQCHTHKYDPLTHEEYYRLFAFLNNADEANVAVYTPEGQRQRAEIFRRTRELEGELRHRHPDWSARMAKWEETVRTGQPAWQVVKPELDASGGQKHYLLGDGSILAQGYAPSKHTTDFTVKVEGTVRAVRLELLNDPNLPVGGPGRALDGLCALTEFKLDVAPADRPAARQAVKITAATADVNPTEQPLAVHLDDRTKRKRVTGPIAYAVDGKDETAWGLDIGPGRSNVPRQAVFVLEKPVTFPAGTLLTFRLVQNHGGWNSNDNQNNNLGRFRFSVTDAERAAADPIPANVREILAVPTDRRSEAQAAAVFSHWRTTVPDWKPVNDQIEALWKTHPRPTTQLVLSERGAMRSTHLLDRGDFLKPKKPVTPGAPAFLHPLPAGAKPDRLTFAKWLVDPRSPTTGRSVVNRVWQSYFGLGLVRTSEDLGLQSEAPSHPELLDYLASVFTASPADGGPAGRRERGTAGARDGKTLRPAVSQSLHRSVTGPKGLGWSLKRLHRLIVTSATYRQSSRVTPALVARDPENRLLARGPRFRVEAEAVRDVALAASGLLERKLGGPPVYPPAPEFLFLPPASYGTKHWPVAMGPDRYRRALYTFQYRSVPYPALQVFDAPNGDQSCVRRTRSNTPLQALTTLNEPLFVEAARALARKTLAEAGSGEAARLEHAFRRCVSRKPTTQEVGVLLEFVRGQIGRFKDGKADPWAVLSDDPKKRPGLPGSATPEELAGWTLLSRVLLNLDETITKE